MDSPPDDKIMLLVKNGDPQKLGVLFERYQLPLYNFYLRMTEDRALSEDLVQDVFFRILKYRHTYREGTPFSTWMYQIARNARIDHFRKARHESASEVEENEATYDGRTVFQALQAEQEEKLLRRALARLPEEKREVLILSRYQNLRYEEIAKVCGCETGTVKTRVFRAVQELRQAYFRLAGEKAS